MPHIIVEYSRDLEAEIAPLLKALHAEAAALPGVNPARLKARAKPYDHVLVGEGGVAASLCHTTLLILDGRDVDTRQQYGQALFRVVKDRLDSRVTTTLEVRELEGATYQS